MTHLIFGDMGFQQQYHAFLREKIISSTFLTSHGILFWKCEF